MNMNRNKHFWWVSLMITVVMLTTAACSSSGSNSSAANYPEKPFTIVAPSGAGGGLDLTARSLSKSLANTKLVEQPILVENRPGGGQAVGLADYITKDKKDPYKLFLPSAPILINHYKKEGTSAYSHKDLTPLAQLTKDYGAIAVPVDSKYKDLPSLIADLKTNPDSVILAGGSAPGSQDHLIAMLPAYKAGVDPKTIKFISYDGGGEALTALLGGTANVLASDISGLSEYMEAGQVRVLGISAPERLPGEFKDIPTYKEQGIDAEFVIWRGLFGPKDMDANHVKYWEEKIKQLSATEEWKKELEANGWEDGYKNSADFAAFLGEQEKLIQEILKSLDMLK